MPRIQPATAGEIAAEAQPLLDGIERKLGRVPNFVQTLAHSPAALQAFFGYSTALAQSRLSVILREQIALTVAAFMDCDYCIAAHGELAEDIGLDQDELQAGLSGRSDDPETSAVLTFVQDLLEHRGRIDDASLQSLRVHDFDEAQIVEIIATVGLYQFTTTFNQVADTELDFDWSRPDQANAA